MAAEGIPTPSWARTRSTSDRLLRAWAFLILGGALFTPHVMVVSVVKVAFGDHTASLLDLPELAPDAVAALPLVFLTGLLPVVPDLEALSVRTLLRPELPWTAPRTWPGRLRAALWFTVHLGVGAVAAAVTVAVAPLAAVLAISPFVPIATPFGETTAGWRYAAGPLAAIGLLAAVVGFVVLAARLLTAAATALLGPSAADRLSVERRRRTHAEIANLAARDLHDGLGHTLSVVTLQAAGARAMLDRDPAFVLRALTAIEDTSRAAAADLDQVLGLLRSSPELPSGSAPTRRPRAGHTEPVGGPTLLDVETLVARADGTGQLSAQVTGDVRRVPEYLSGQAYRILQEGLTNALRQADATAVQVRVGVTGTEVELEVVNPCSARSSVLDSITGPVRGGNGIPGVRARVAGLGGTATVGRDGDRWRFVVRLPLEKDR